MSVTVTTIPEARMIQVDGDVTLAIDFPGSVRAPGWIARAADPDLFYLAFSDGTLLRGNAEGVFDVEVGGAAIVNIGANRATLNWHIEWVALADRDQAMTAELARERDDQLEAQKAFHFHGRIDDAVSVQLQS